MSRRGEQLLTMILAGACGVLFVLALAFEFGVGAGYSWLPADTDTAADGANAIDRSPFKLPPENDFAVIYQRPLFNEDRKPAPEVDEGPIDANLPPPVPLNVALTGTVQSPGLRLAMVQDKVKNQSFAIREGMPLPGDLGGWNLIRVKDRSAIFKNTSGDEVEVELTVASGSPKTGAHPATAAQPGPATFGPGPGTGAPPPARPNAANPQSEDLQRRIEERRQQMREAAERAKKTEPKPPQNPAQPQSPPQEL